MLERYVRGHRRAIFRIPGSNLAALALFPYYRLSLKELEAIPKKVGDFMAATLTREPYQLSPRFFRAMQAKALALEANALRDELDVNTFEHPDQIRRHRLLIQAQRDEAERLRDFLQRTTTETDGVEPE